MATTAVLDLTPATLNLKLYRGDLVELRLQINERDENGEDTGQPAELPSEGWTAQLRNPREGDEVLGTITVNATQAADGVLFLTFPDTTDLPPSFFYDVQTTGGGGTRTWLRGKVSLVQDVTRDA